MPSPAPSPCEHHGPEHVCEFDGLDTDASGFVHRQECRGRIALRLCERCLNWTTPGRWNHADWFHCLDCVPLGRMSDKGARSSPHPTDPKKVIRWP